MAIPLLLTSTRVLTVPKSIPISKDKYFQISNIEGSVTHKIINPQQFYLLRFCKSAGDELPVSFAIAPRSNPYILLASLPMANRLTYHNGF